MAVTVADVLEMPVVRAAEPVLVAGADGLRRAVRWVHTSELPDIADLLRAGDLVLTTGIALPDREADLSDFARSLAESGAAGLFVELGRRWDSVPAALTAACDGLGLPLAALRREIRFASLAQSVGERIVDRQLHELRESQQVHDIFTALSVDEAAPDDILAAVSRLAGAAVVLESEGGRILDYVAGPGDTASFLEDWQRRSAAVHPRGRTSWDPSNGWLVVRIGRTERRWGRLVIDSPAEPPQRLIAVAERGAAALAMHMLHHRERTSRERQVHSELLVALLADPAAAEVEQRCNVAGMPTAERQFIALALRHDPEHVRRNGITGELLSAVVHAVATRRMAALTSAIGDVVRVLLSVPRCVSATQAADDLVGTIPRRVGFLAAAGGVVDDFASADRTLREAHQILLTLPAQAASGTVHHLVDAQVRGLLTALIGDERLAVFCDRQLAGLRSADVGLDGRLEQALRALLEHPNSKSAAAASINVSRPVLYDRIAQVERILGVCLDDGETRTSLHLALLAADLLAGTHEPGA